MSKPLIASKEEKKAAADFHKAVFALYGYVCWLHRAKDPKSKMPATDAAHIIKRSRLGTKLAYATPEFARPLCRPCHRIQELGLDRMYWFPYVDELAAVLVHNRIAKSPLPLPEQRVDAWNKRDE